MLQISAVRSLANPHINTVIVKERGATLKVIKEACVITAQMYR